MMEPVPLPEKLDTVAAPVLKEMVTTSGDLVLDGSQVRKLGALCAQVLVAAQRSRPEDRGPLVVSPSFAMQDDLRLLGLSSEFMSQGDDA